MRSASCRLCAMCFSRNIQLVTDMANINGLQLKTHRRAGCGPQAGLVVLSAVWQSRSLSFGRVMGKGELHAAVLSHSLSPGQEAHPCFYGCFWRNCHMRSWVFEKKARSWIATCDMCFGTNRSLHCSSYRLQQPRHNGHLWECLLMLSLGPTKTVNGTSGTGPRQCFPRHGQFLNRRRLDLTVACNPQVHCAG